MNSNESKTELGKTNDSLSGVNPDKENTDLDHLAKLVIDQLKGLTVKTARLVLIRVERTIELHSIITSH